MSHVNKSGIRAAFNFHKVVFKSKFNFSISYSLTFLSEMVLIISQDLATGGQFRDVWEDHIKDSMGPNYAMVKSAHMGQIRWEP